MLKVSIFILIKLRLMLKFEFLEPNYKALFVL